MQMRPNWKTDRLETASTYLELRAHEVVDDGVDGAVEVAHAVSDDAGVHQELAKALVAGRVGRQGPIHHELRREEGGEEGEEIESRSSWDFLLAVASIKTRHMRT